nr:LytTR family DNA-binding domain-containing protein [Mucilaginibacter sp. L294]
MGEVQTQPEQLVDTYQPQVKYNDLYLRLTACLVASHIIIVYGETESVFQILLTPGYYKSLAGSFVIAFILFTALRKICLLLDKKFDWKQRSIERVGLQFIFGLVIPGIFAFMLAAFYFRLNGINIFRTTYLRYDFQFILLQILLINAYYITYYFYARWSYAELVLKSLSKDLDKVESNPVKETFQVAKGASNILLPINDIAYCYRDGDTNFLRTFTGEDFFISQSLDEVQLQLPEKRFFRANRQMIIHRSSCKGFELITYGKLKAIVSPSFSDDITISQKRALAFKKWIDQAA